MSKRYRVSLRPTQAKYCRVCTDRRPWVGRWARILFGVSIAGGATAGDAAVGYASAYFIREQSATAMSSAFADATAGAEDVTYMFYNNAALAQERGHAIGVVGSIVSSHVRLREARASTSTGAAVEGGRGGDAGGKTLIPALYGAWDPFETFDGQARIRFGVAINAPFGFETDYQDGWVGRYYALQSRLSSLAVNPAVAWTPFDGVAVAVGLQAQRIDAKLSNAVDFGSLGVANGVPGAVAGTQDGFAKLVGDDWGFGWTAGLLLEPFPGTRFGIGWRSSVRHEIEGDARLRLDNDGIGAALGQSGGTTSAKAKLTTPEILSIGARHQIDDAWTIMAEATWTRWSRNRALRIRFDDAMQPDEISGEDWRDTWFLAAGTSVRLDAEWTLRGGIGWDQSPARNRTRTPRTPANSGLLVAAGAGWRPSAALDLAVAFGHYFIESARIDLQDQSPGNAARGNLSGSSENAVDMIAVQAQWSF
jgi:long-chain fatty acid transport protein